MLKKNNCGAWEAHYEWKNEKTPATPTSTLHKAAIIYALF